jgi:hypothetical protein
VHELYFDVAGDVVLGEPGGSGDANCVRAGTGVLCTDLDGDFTLELKVTVPDTKPHVVTVTLALPPGYEDEKHSNNASSITLDADDPAPVSQLNFQSQLTIREDVGNNDFVLGTRLGGLPEGPVTIHFAVNSRSGETRLLEPPSECARADGGFSCSISEEQEPLDLAFRVKLPGNRIDTVTLTASYEQDSASADVVIDNRRGNN